MKPTFLKLSMSLGDYAFVNANQILYFHEEAESRNSVIHLSNGEELTVTDSVDAICKMLD